MKQKKKRISMSLKAKLALVIVCILAIVSLSLTTILVGQARVRLIDEAKTNGMNKVREIADQIDFSQEFQKITEDMLADKVTSLSYLIGQKEVITNEYLEDISKSLNISEINIADNSRKIIFSNMSGNLDYVYPSDHALSSVFSGTKISLLNLYAKVMSMARSINMAVLDSQMDMWFRLVLKPASLKN